MVERDGEMDLKIKNKENLEFLITQILGKLNLINAGAIKPEHFNVDQYEEIYDLHQLIMKRDNFSPKEMQAIAEELGHLRKK